jgi:serine/threonine protein kinase
LLVTPVEDLGYVSFDVPNWQLLNGLGRGRFSSVYSCRHASNTNDIDDIAVLKVFRGDTAELADFERYVLTSLREGGLTDNIPSVIDLYTHPTFHGLILTPVGVPVLPCPIGADITPYMLVTLLRVVQQAHMARWIHRDIKPDNIYLDRRNTAKIILNDWSSAAEVGVECNYVGTKLFGDKPRTGNKHTPEPCLDLQSLVKTAYCLTKQRIPPVVDNDLDVQHYWDQVKDQSPLFSKAMEFARMVNYDALADLFKNSCW